MGVRVPLLVVLVVALFACSLAAGETVVEAWRSPFGEPRSASVDPSDGSVWVVTGSSVMHLSADASVLSQTDGFWNPRSVSANSSDGSCWVADAVNSEVAHVAAGGEVLLRVASFSRPWCISVDSANGSCWVADAWAGQVVHLAANGSEMSRADLPGAVSVSANPTDGSCWAADYEAGLVVHLAADGTVLWQGSSFYQPEAVSVNTTDGSCWVADTYHSEVVHLGADGTELWRGNGFYYVSSVSVNPVDGSCWVTTGDTVFHLADTGTVLWSKPGLVGSRVSLSVNPIDGSCWVANEAGGVEDVLAHLAADGTELWRGIPPFLRPESPSVDPVDGSCWVALMDGVAHVDADGGIMWRGSALPAHCVSVDSSDGSCWAGLAQGIAHIRADGTLLWQGAESFRPSAIAANPADGTCWVAGHEPNTGEYLVVHLSATGAELWRGPINNARGLSVNPADGSCWVADSDQNQIVHLREDGSELWRGGDLIGPEAMSVNPNDGSCWAAGLNAIVRLAADGSEVLRKERWSPVWSLSANPVDGSCWVAESDEGHYDGSVVHLAEDGTELYRGVGCTDSMSVSVDPTDGSCWVAETMNSQIVRLAVLDYEGPVFPDIPVWFWAHDATAACLNANIVKGYDDGLYHPELSVTRDQMAVYISRALVSPSGDAAIPDGPATPSFSDVPPNQWAYKQIEYAVSQNVVKGYDDGTYHTEYKVDRGTMAVYIARAMVAPGGDAAIPDPLPPATFPDVPTDFWSCKQVEYCVSQGVVTGYDDGLYHPDWVVTRDQMAVYIARALGLL